MPNNVTGDHRFAVYFAGETSGDGVLGRSTMSSSVADSTGQVTPDGDETSGDSEGATTAYTSDNEADNTGGRANTSAEPVIIAIGGLLLLVAGGGIALITSRARRSGTRQ